MVLNHLVPYGRLHIIAQLNYGPAMVQQHGSCMPCTDGYVHLYVLTQTNAFAGNILTGRQKMVVNYNGMITLCETVLLEKTFSFLIANVKII